MKDMPAFALYNNSKHFISFIAFDLGIEDFVTQNSENDPNGKLIPFNFT